MPEALSRIGLAWAGLFAAVLALEAATRWLGLAPEFSPIEIDQPYAKFESSPNPILRYVPKPGSKGVSGYGIRDFEFEFQKRADTFRVVVVGDSIGWGFCSENESVPIASTFAKVLERSLNASPVPGFQKVEVINLSVSGYDTVQEVEFLRVKGLALDPDLVLVSYCLNDSIDSSIELNALRYHPNWEPELSDSDLTHSAFAWSHLYRTVWYRWSLLRDSAADSEAASSDRREVGFDRLRAMSEGARGGIVGEAGEQRRAGDGFETLVVIFPYLDGALPYPHIEDHRTTRRAATKRGFQVLDLLPIFQRATGRDLPSLRGRCVAMHPDESGHNVAAEAIETFIRDKLGNAASAVDD